MKSLVLTSVCWLALSGIASAQAAVEGALTHALSGATSATAGKALGQIGNQLAGKLGQQTSNALRPAVKPGAQKVKVPQTPTPSRVETPAPTGGSFIASIQGGEQPKPCVEQKSEKASGDAPKRVGCGKATADQESHPSEITLPAPE